MAWRTNEQKVQGILGNNHDGKTDLAPFIDTANAVTDSVVTCAANKKITHSAAILERIEAYLAAHFYGHADQFYSEKRTENASATFQGETKTGYESTQYGQTAISLDISGCLRAMSKGQVKVSIGWLGLPPSEQTDYVDRD